MIQTSCLTSDQLQAYLQGTLPEEASDEVEIHLQSCDRCNDQATRLESNDDSVIRHLRLQPALPDQYSGRTSPEDPTWAACLERLRQVPLIPDDKVESGPNLPARLEPTSVYHYRLDGLLGRGGMGVVYRGWHPQLHREVAVKVLSASRVDDAASVARFQREMRAAGTLDHAAIVRALDAGVWHGTYYLVMELVDGVDLSKLVRLQGPLSAGDACALITQAAEALQHAHEHQVVHRDIKPSNLMLTRDGQLKILDFGLARLEHAGMANQAATSDGRLIGTLDYLAPEQAGGTQQVDGRADVYGLGATLFKLLTGEPPHGSSNQRPMLEHLQRLTGQAAERVDRFRHDLPPSLVDAVSEMLQREPNKRIASAANVAIRLRPFASESGLATLGQETRAIMDQTCPEASWDESVNRREHADALDRPPEATPFRGRRWFGVFGIALLMLSAIMVGAFAGVTIVLKTGDGELTVESEVDDITLELLPDGASDSLLQVRAGQSTTIRSGRYELRVAGAADSVTVDPKQIVVRRGDQRIVTVRKKQKAPKLAWQPPRPKQQPTERETQPDVTPKLAVPWDEQLRIRQGELQIKLAMHLDSLGQRHPLVVATKRELEIVEQLINGTEEQATHKGRTYAQWQRIVLLETETSTVLDAIKSLVKLSQPEQHDKTIDTLFQVAEKFGREFPTALAMRDAHIDLIANWDLDVSEPYFEAGSANWKQIITQLAEELEQLPDDVVNRKLQSETTGRNELHQLFVIVFAASKVKSESTRPRNALLIDQLADQERSELVKSVAMFVQLAVLDTEASEKHVAQLRRNLTLAAPAVVAGMLRANQSVAVDEMGQALATSVVHAVSARAYRKEGLVTPVIRRLTELSAESPPQANDSALLRAFGRHLVRAWEGQESHNFPGQSSLLMIAGLRLLDDDTRQWADRQLVAQIERQLDQRATFQTVADLRANLGDPNQTPWLIQLATTLLHVRGEFPLELRKQPLDLDTPLGQEFSQWRASLVTAESEKYGTTWLIWFPVETSEAYLRAWGRLAAASDIRRGLLANPQTHAISSNVVLPEIAIAIAAANVADAELQSGLALNLNQVNNQPEWRSWLQLPKYRDLLYSLARSSASPSARVMSLVLAQRAGSSDEACEQLAFELLRMELSGTDKGALLLVASNLDAPKVTPQVLDQFLQIASAQINRTEPFLRALVLMEKSGVVTESGLALLRASFGERERQFPLSQLSNPGSRRTSGSAGDQLTRIVARGTPPEIFRQALKTTMRLGPLAKEVLPQLEAALGKVRSLTNAPGSPAGRGPALFRDITSSASKDLETELIATIAALKPAPPSDDPTDDDPSNRRQELK